MKKLDFIILEKDDPENLYSCLKSINSNKFDDTIEVNVYILDVNSSKQNKNIIFDKILKYDIFKKINLKFSFVGKLDLFSNALILGLNCALNKKNLADMICISYSYVKFDNNFVTHAIELDKTTAYKNNKNNSFGAICIPKKNYEELKILNKHIIGNEYAIDEFFSNANISNEYVEYNKNDNVNLKKSFECNKKIKKLFKDTKKPIIYSFAKSENEIPKFNHSEKYEFICFTNFESTSKYAFNCNDILNELNIFSNDILSKEYIKLHPHILFNENNISIWVENDSALKVIDNLNIEEELKKNNPIIALKSNVNCIYKYLVELKDKNAISEVDYNNILELFKWYSFPTGISMSDTSIMIRHHDNERCNMAMGKIWMLINKYNTSDLMFFNFILWILKF